MAEAVGHFATALTAHERHMRLDGAAVPAVLAELAEFCREIARSRHGATTLAVGGHLHDDLLVTERLLLTKSETAERLSVSVRTVERIVAAGRLVQVRVDGARRFRVSDLNAYVNGLAGTSNANRSSMSAASTTGASHGTAPDVGHTLPSAAPDDR